MSQLSFYENGFHFGPMRVTAEHDAAHKRKRCPLLLLILINMIVLLLAVAVVLYSLYFSDLFRFGFVGEEKEIVYTLEVRDASGALPLIATEGTEVRDAVHGVLLGTVVSATLHESSSSVPLWTANDGGVTTDAVTVVKLNMKGRVRYRKDDGYYAENIRLAVNGEYQVKIGAFTGQGVCVTLQCCEEGGN